VGACIFISAQGTARAFWPTPLDMPASSWSPAVKATAVPVFLGEFRSNAGSARPGSANSAARRELAAAVRRRQVFLTADAGAALDQAIRWRAAGWRHPGETVKATCARNPCNVPSPHQIFALTASPRAG
jgi:hypothetical protein